MSTLKQIAVALFPLTQWSKSTNSFGGNFVSLGSTFLWERALVAFSRISSAWHERAHTHTHREDCAQYQLRHNTQESLCTCCQGNSHILTAFPDLLDLNGNNIQTLCVSHRRNFPHTESAHQVMKTTYEWDFISESGKATEGPFTQGHTREKTDSFIIHFVLSLVFSQNII